MRSRSVPGAALAVCLLLASVPLAGAERRPIAVADFAALHDVLDPQLSPDGEWVAYVVRTPDLLEDKRTSDVYMTSWDGSRTVRLTFTPKESEHSPRFSPDGRLLAFLSSRGDENDEDQLWVMNRLGGEAEKVTEAKGGVVDYAWAPDGKRLVLVVKDSEPEPPKPQPKESAEKPGEPEKGSGRDEAASAPAKKRDEKEKPPRPIVIDRYYFKEDQSGYLDTRRQHLYLFDLASRRLAPLTAGLFNEAMPAWSPDGATIAFVSKRGEEFDRTYNWDVYAIEPRAGASPRALTTFDGADNDPDWESPLAFSPDGKRIAYLQGGPKELSYFGQKRLAVVPVAGGEARVLTAELDRDVLAPRFSKDGSSLYFLFEDDGTQPLGRIPAAGGKIERVLGGARDVDAFATGGAGRVVVLSSTPAAPGELFALEPSGPRALTHQNDALLAGLRLASVETIAFKSKDGTEIHGFLVRPPGAAAGRKVPAILRIHGGPVSQYGHGFMLEWQVLAASGYAVVAANPRGSSGRGQAFAKAIFADWGNKDAEDVLAAVDHVVALGVADPERLGVGGWSYGGILTNYVIAKDRRFKAATSGAGISNILAGYGTDMYIRDYEAELGPPWKSPDVWLKLSYPFLHADRITTPTLFLCGEKDFNVPLLNSEQMYQALRSLGRDTQLVIYPDQFHEIRRPSFVKDRLERYLAWYGKQIPHAGAQPAR